MPPTHFDQPQPFIRVGGRTLDNTPPSRGAMRPSCAGTLSLQTQRAQETPGARCTRSRACRIGSTRVSRHRPTGTPGISCAMVLTAYFALSPVTGLSCHRHPQEACKKLASRELDASVGASRPHGFAVRKCALSSAAPLASIASQPYVRDDRETPLCVGGDGKGYKTDLGPMGSKISDFQK